MILGEATQTHHDLVFVLPIMFIRFVEATQTDHDLAFVLPIMFIRLGEATQTDHDLKMSAKIKRGCSTVGQQFGCGAVHRHLAAIKNEAVIGNREALACPLLHDQHRDAEIG